MPSRKAEPTNRRCDGLTKYALNQPAGSDVKILLWLLLLPLMVTFVAFAIANRHLVTLSLDPTPLSIEAPLYGLVFASIFAGLVTGGLIAWMRAGRVRRRASPNFSSACSARPWRKWPFAKLASRAMHACARQRP